MPHYIPQLLHSLDYKSTGKPTHNPSQYKPPVFTSKPQLTAAPEKSPPLNDKQKTYIQKAVGGLLYYARSKDSTQLLALSDVASSQATPTQWTMNSLLQLFSCHRWLCSF